MVAELVVAVPKRWLELLAEQGLVVMLNDALISVYALYRHRCGYGCGCGILGG